MRHANPILLGLAGLAVALTSACSSVPPRTPTPLFYERLDQTQRPVDPASSLSMINQYRANHGLRPLVWNEALAGVAKSSADKMAAADKVLGAAEVNVAGELAAAYRPKSYVANLSAGYRTFAEAFSGWRELKDNNAHMLDPRVTQVGLATSYVPGSKYRVFWALVAAEPM